MKRIFVSLTIIIIGLSAWRVQQHQHTQKSTKTSSQVSSTASSVQNFNKSQFSVNTPGSPWWIVNKTRPLPSGYTPKNLVVPTVKLRLGSGSEQMHVDATVAPAIQKLFDAAKANGTPLLLASGYRSEGYQRQLYEGYVKNDGQVAADKYSARPGTSEHQTGFAFDICPDTSDCQLVQSFGDTDTGKWVASHAHEFGFIVRYQKGKDAVTGYEYEPWHLRYVGVPLASELFKTNQTMEEFFNIE